MTLDGIIPVLALIGTLTGIPGLIVAMYNTRAKADSDQRLHQQAVTSSDSSPSTDSSNRNHRSSPVGSMRGVRRLSWICSSSRSTPTSRLLRSSRPSHISARKKKFSASCSKALERPATTSSTVSGKRRSSSPDVNEKFEQLDHLFLKKSISASVYREPRTPQDYEALFRASDSNDVRRLVDELKARLQRLLGDVAG
jgi:hypothetical protein